MTIRHVIIISIDNLRFDCVGYQPDKTYLLRDNVHSFLHTPVLDELGAQSVVFTQAISVAPYTTASHAAVLTGAYPPRHGVRAFFGNSMSTRVTSLSEILTQAGFQTILYTDTPFLFETVASHRGFKQVLPPDDNELFHKLKEMKNDRVFLFAHLFDLHGPFCYSDASPENEAYFEMMSSQYRMFGLDQSGISHNPYDLWNYLWRQALPLKGYAPYDRRFLFRLYLEGISKFDQGRFQKFLDGLNGVGLLQDALLVVLSDHGEGKSFHNEPLLFSHAGELFDEVIRVVLLMYCNGVLKPGRVDEQVSLVDVFPTIVNILQLNGTHVESSPGIDGVDLLSTTSVSAEHKQPRWVYSESWLGDDRYNPAASSTFSLYQRAVRSPQQKLVLFGAPEDLVNLNILDLPDEKFVGTLSRCVPLRDDPSKNKYIEQLRTGSRSKQSLLTEFMERQRESYGGWLLAYDLVADPCENDPQPVGLDYRDAWQHFSRLIPVFTDPADSSTVRPVIQASDDETVWRRLRDLGYVE